LVFFPSGVCGVSLQLFLLELVNFGDLARVGGTLTEQKAKIKFTIRTIEKYTNTSHNVFMQQATIMHFYFCRAKTFSNTICSRLKLIIPMSLLDNQLGISGTMCCSKKGAQNLSFVLGWRAHSILGITIPSTITMTYHMQKLIKVTDSQQHFLLRIRNMKLELPS